MFALETGIIVGADVMGGTWDETYEIVDKHFHLDLAVTFPPGTTDVITGATSTTEHTERLTLALPNDFEERDITVQTSRGPLAVNCRKIRGWPDCSGGISSGGSRGRSRASQCRGAQP